MAGTIFITPYAWYHEQEYILKTWLWHLFIDSRSGIQTKAVSSFCQDRIAGRKSVKYYQKFPQRECFFWGDLSIKIQNDLSVLKYFTWFHNGEYSIFLAEDFIVRLMFVYYTCYLQWHFNFPISATEKVCLIVNGFEGFLKVCKLNIFLWFVTFFKKYFHV